VNGFRHEDLTKLSFPSETFDIIISSEVFEHIPKPYLTHEEVFRVLKPGGRHIFTVPFHQTRFLDEILAVPGEREPEFLKPPIYHLDPLRSEGVLVYTIFSVQMLSKLEDIGFRTHMYLLYHPTLGILGANGLVFEAIKE
jgi:ubiquinone/menaquinone biosynthesis C-methylase UbiE